MDFCNSREASEAYATYDTDTDADDNSDIHEHEVPSGLSARYTPTELGPTLLAVAELHSCR